MTGKTTSRVRRSILGAMLLTAAVGNATPAAAATSCVRSGDTVNVGIAGADTLFEQFSLERTPAGDIQLVRSALLSSTTTDCGDATTTNTNTINVAGTEALETLSIQQKDGGFAPGQTLEGSLADSEIEINVHLGGASEAAIVVGTNERDVYVMGAKGVNVNGDGDGNDIRFGPSVDLPGMSGVVGRDRLVATGGSGTGGQAISPVVLVGGDDEDVLRGGSGADYISGMDGPDLISGGPGSDRLGADASPLTFPPMTDAGEDVIRGGPGNDVLRGGLDDDRLDGGAGDDEEHGSDGHDIFLQGTQANGSDHLFGGEDRDEARYQARRSAVRVTLDNKRNDGANGERDSVGFKLDLEDVTGGRGDDVIKGSKAANVLAGRAGGDLLVGKAGIDICIGGPGRDEIQSCE